MTGVSRSCGRAAGGHATAPPRSGENHVWPGGAPGAGERDNIAPAPPAAPCCPRRGGQSPNEEISTRTARTCGTPCSRTVPSDQFVPDLGFSFGSKRKTRKPNPINEARGGGLNHGTVAADRRPARRRDGRRADT